MEVAVVEAVLNQGMDRYSKADEYGNSRIWRKIRSGEKRRGVHRI